MKFRKIDYLEWARTHMGRVKFDLAKSDARPVTKEDLGLTLDQIDLSAPGEDGVAELRELLAKRCGAAPSNVLVTGGATMGIYLACAAVLEPGGQVLLESPNYEPLYRVPVQLGAQVRMLDRRFDRGFQLEVEELERRISRVTRAVLMTNLHNPSGAATSPEKMATIGQIARDYGTYVIVSEVFLDNAFSPGHRPAAGYGPNMISIGSLSKVYGLGGLRIGWIVAAEPVLQKARLALDYLECDMPVPSQKIAVAALRKAPELAQRCRDAAKRNFAVVGEWVARRDDVQWVEPAGGTVCMIRLPAGMDAQALSKVLREKYSTLVVPGEYFWIQGFIRISCGMDEEILRQGLKNVGRAIDQAKARRT